MCVGECVCGCVSVCCECVCVCVCVCVRVGLRVGEGGGLVRRECVRVGREPIGHQSDMECWPRQNDGADDGDAQFPSVGRSGRLGRGQPRPGCHHRHFAVLGSVLQSGQPQQRRYVAERRSQKAWPSRFGAHFFSGRFPASNFRRQRPPDGQPVGCLSPFSRDLMRIKAVLGKNLAGKEKTRRSGLLSRLSAHGHQITRRSGSHSQVHPQPSSSCSCCGAAARWLPSSHQPPAARTTNTKTGSQLCRRNGVKYAVGPLPPKPLPPPPPPPPSFFINSFFRPRGFVWDFVRFFINMSSFSGVRLASFLVSFFRVFLRGTFRFHRVLLSFFLLQESSCVPFHPQISFKLRFLLLFSKFLHTFRLSLGFTRRFQAGPNWSESISLGLDRFFGVH